MIVSSPTAPSRGHASVYPSLDALLAAVRGCRACEAHLPLGPRPVLRAGATARILVVGQAHAPDYLPLPHPSPRNQPWFKHHPWFERQLVPVLRTRIHALVER